MGSARVALPTSPRGGSTGLRAEVRLARERQTAEREARHAADLRAERHAAETASERLLCEITRTEALTCARLAKEREVRWLRTAVASRLRFGDLSPSTASHARNRDDPALPPAPVAFIAQSVSQQPQTSLSRRGSSVRSDGSGDGSEFLAFMCHSGLDTSMASRFLKSRLEELSGLPLVLDSDELLSPLELKRLIKRSRALVLVQSKHVLARPNTLLELLIAVDERVPIVAVNVCGIAHPYASAEGAHFLANLHTLLPLEHPSSAEALASLGLTHLRELAWKLSSTIPHVISVEFNAHASRHMLAAQTSDVCAVISAAKPLPLPSLVDWEAALEAGAAAEATRIARRTELPVGVLLLERAVIYPALQPVAVLIAAVSVATTRAQRLRAEAELISLRVEALEQLLNSGCNLSGSLVRELLQLLQEAIVLLLGLRDATEPKHADLEPQQADLEQKQADIEPQRTERAALQSLRERLGGAAAALSVPWDAAELREIHAFVAESAPPPRAGSGQDSLGGASGPAQDVPGAEVLRAKLQERRCELADAERRQAVHAKGELLEEQAEQILLLAGAGVMPLDFVSRFPLSLAEAERLEAVARSRVLKMPLPVRCVEDGLRELTDSAALAKECAVVIVYGIGKHTQRVLGMAVKDAKGAWLLSAENGMLELGLLARKAAPCQYVVATGQPLCNRAYVDEERERANPLAPLMRLGPETLARIDVAMEKALQPDGFLGQVSNEEFVSRNVAMGTLMAVLSDARHVTITVPLLVGQQVIGSMCCYHFELKDGAAMMERVKKVMMVTTNKMADCLQPRLK